MKKFFNYKINLVPKCHIPSNIHVITSKSGTMDKEIMKSWINTCLKISGPFRNLEKSILIILKFFKLSKINQLFENRTWSYFRIKPVSKINKLNDICEIIKITIYIRYQYTTKIL